MISSRAFTHYRTFFLGNSHVAGTTSRIQTAPRWMIYEIDLTCVILSIVGAFLLRLNFDFSHLSAYPLTAIVVIVASIYAIGFRIYQNYSGIVRHTSLNDVIRIVWLNLFASCALLLVGQLGSIYTGALILPTSVVAIHFFTATFFLIGYRLMVRFLFCRLGGMNPKKGKEKVAVYWTNQDSLALKNVLGNGFSSSMDVVAFLQDSSDHGHRCIETVPLYPTTDVGFSKLKKAEVQLILLPDGALEGEAMNRVVELCLKHSIRVQQLPPIYEWVDRGLRERQLKDINIEDLLEREPIRIDNVKIQAELEGQRILVTGAAGSIGSELVKQLIAFNPALIVLCDKAETPLHDLVIDLKEQFPQFTAYKAFIGDVCDRERMEYLFEVYNPTIIYHAAAYKHVPLMEDHPSVAILNNVLGTKNLSEVASLYGAEKFIMVSTDKAVNPTNVMGASKRICEIYAQSLHYHLETVMPFGQPTKFVTTRFGNVLGSNGSVIPLFKRQLAKGGPLLVTHPEITRYFMTIPEACLLVIEASVMGQGGEIFVFDMGKPVRILDLAEKMIHLSNKVKDVDISIEFTGLRPGEKLYEELLTCAENTIPTYHKKIMIAKVPEYDFDEILEQVDDLILSAHKHYTDETVRLMKQLVPEFLSKNSQFEKLDAVLVEKAH